MGEEGSEREGIKEMLYTYLEGEEPEKGEMTI